MGRARSPEEQQELTVCARKDVQILEEAVQLATEEKMEAAETMGAAERGATSTGPTSWQGTHSSTSQSALSRSTLTSHDRRI